MKDKLIGFDKKNLFQEIKRPKIKLEHFFCYRRSTVAEWSKALQWSEQKPKDPRAFPQTLHSQKNLYIIK